MVEKQNIINPENNSSVSPDEMITPENSIAIANAVEEDPNFQVVVDDMAAEGRRKNETILTSRESLHAETVKKLERRILAERNALEGADINIEERENSKIWWDMGTDHNESLDAAIEAENLDREQIQKRLDEYQALLAQAQENYKKTQDDQKLGDEAVKAGDYQKAQEFYNQAARWISHQNQEIQDKIGESAQLAEDTVAQAELWKEIAWGVRTTAIVVGATLAAIPSGWTSLAGLWSALAVGTTAWALGQAAEQGWEVYFNNKDGTEAFIDGAKGTWQAALDSALAAVGMGTGLKVAGMAGKGILSTGAIAGWVNTATQSAARTGIDVSQKTATFIAENWDKVKDLSASEIANVYAAHMAEQGLAPGDIAKNFAFDVATWALGWGIWAKFGPLQEATKWAIKQLGLQASEVWSDAALAVLSAHARNYMDNGTWDASPEEIQKELANALTGSLTGKYAAARKSMSQARWSNIEPPSATTEEVTPDNPRTVVPDKIFDTGNPEELTTGNLRPRIQETIRNAGDEDAQNTKRMEVAEEIIQQLTWRREQLTPVEQKVILDAHDVKPSGTGGKYTAADIAKKTRILAQAFPWNENKSIREAFIRNGIAGTPEAMVADYQVLDASGKVWIPLDGHESRVDIGGRKSHVKFDQKTGEFQITWDNGRTAIIPKGKTSISHESLKAILWDVPQGTTLAFDWKPDWKTVTIRKVDWRKGVWDVTTSSSEKIWVRSPIRRNTQLMDPEIVPRDMPIAIVGDTHGSYEGYLKNLQSLWVVDSSGNFTGTTERIVLVGDILGDRNTGGVPTYQHIDKLRAQGADIHVLAGNHEDFVIGYLTDWDHGGGSAFANALVNNQWKWLLEFWKFANPDLVSLGRDFPSESEILSAMRNRPDGMKVLESMCQLKLCEQIDDSLYVHTDPTEPMMDMVQRYWADRINQIFQQNMRANLIEWRTINTTPSFQELREVFLHTNNWRDDHRTGSPLVPPMTPNQGVSLRNRWVNTIIHGHTDHQGQGYDVGWVMTYSVDNGAFKKWVDDGRRAVALLWQDGRLRGSR